MTQKTPLIIGIGGTPRKHSLSRGALSAALDAARALGAGTELIDLGNPELPMYNPDLKVEDYAPGPRDALTRMLELCATCDAMFWACPTYHGTISGLFKNALDHIEYISDAPSHYLTGKAVGMITINDSKPLGAMALSAQELRAWVAPSHLVLSKADFDEAPAVRSEAARRRLARMAQELYTFSLR
jgi:FMN reductase